MKQAEGYSALLHSLMEQAGIGSLKALAQTAGVSPRQLTRLRRGEALQMRVDILLKLSQALQIPLIQLLTTFTPVKLLEAPAASEMIELKQEYQRLSAQLQQQRQTLWQEFQQSSLEILESLLLQWPTAVAAAQENPQLPAVRLLPLLRPLEQLLQQWGIEAIAPVGAELPYEPQYHQLIEGTAQPGDLVKVRYTGYRQGDKLLYRAKVRRIEDVRP